MGVVVPLSSARSHRSSPARSAEPRLTARQLCNILGVSVSTLKRWKLRGCPYEPWSNRLHRFVLSDVLAWREENV